MQKFALSVFGVCFVLLSGLVVSLAAEAEKSSAEPYLEEGLVLEGADHWAFRRGNRPDVPKVKQKEQVRNPIDAFLLAQLGANGLAYSPQASRRVLIRRLSFDLLGLPPTPEQVEEFENDKSPDAYERLVDRLLASPHYGERWAQHWLDVVRFAESNGYELDAERPQAWRYRDYVIRSLNADKPYDQFLHEQIAGDLLAGDADPKEVADLFIATGFHRCGQVHVVSGNVNKEENRQEIMTEMVIGIGSIVMGVTINCARCHDHKFDPISLGDYYKLQAFFAGTEYDNVNLATPKETEQLAERLAKFVAQSAPIKNQISEIEAPYRKQLLDQKIDKLPQEAREAHRTPANKRTEPQKKLVKETGSLVKIHWDEVLEILSDEDRAKRAKLKAQMGELEAKFPRLPPQAWAVKEKTPPPTQVLKRGEITRKAGTVEPAVPQIFPSPKAVKNRLELARWLTGKDHPLTPRVIVNRLWQHHFGQGIVSTPNDFGTRGDPPSHPELLDWLAAELIEPTWNDGSGNDWSMTPWGLKRLHKLIVTSAAYRQVSTADNVTAQRLDPDNKWLWRMNRSRLEAEAIRDSMLSVAGSLNPAVGGQSVKVPLEPEVYDLIFTEDEPENLWIVDPDPKQHDRRSIYLFNRRNVRMPIFEAFDQPDTLNPCGARAVSTFAPQALILMNGPIARAEAKRFASQLINQFPDADDTRRLDQLFSRSLARKPTEQEAQLARQFLAEQEELLELRLLNREPIGLPHGLPKSASPANARAWADLCLAVFNMNEFIYVD